jgi:hypothetical protein
MAAQLSEHWTHSVWRRVAPLVAAGVPEGALTSPLAPRRLRHKRLVRLTPAQAQALVAEYKAGSSIDDVARKYGIHHATAAAHLKAAGVVTRPPKTGIPRDQLEAALALREQGWSYSKIGAHYGCSRTAATNSLNKRRGL